MNLQSGLTKLEVQTSAQFDDHECIVWRVCWNITGTILASSGDDGCVRMFKSKFFIILKVLNWKVLFAVNYMNSWKPVAVLKGDGTQVPNETHRASMTSAIGLPTPPISQTARYIKLGTISQSREVPWH